MGLVRMISGKLKKTELLELFSLTLSSGGFSARFELWRPRWRTRSTHDVRKLKCPQVLG